MGNIAPMEARSYLLLAATALLDPPMILSNFARALVHGIDIIYALTSIVHVNWHRDLKKKVEWENNSMRVIIRRHVSALLPICAIAAAQIVSAASLVSESDVKYRPATTGLMPTWSGGALITLDGIASATPVIHILGNDSREETPIVLTVPEATLIKINSAVRGSDGRIAVGGVLHDKDGHGSGFIALVASDRGSSQFVKTFPYIPYLVSLAPDGSIWTQGEEIIKGRAESPWVDESHGVLRHFDPKGKLMDSYIPHSSLLPLDAAQNLNQLASSAKGVAWYSNQAQAYYEIGSDGVVKKYPGIQLKGWPTGLALTDNGAAFVSFRASGINQGYLYTLDRSAGTWKNVELPADVKASDLVSMYGGDGNRIALRLVNLDAIRLVTVK